MRESENHNTGKTGRNLMWRVWVNAEAVKNERYNWVKVVEMRVCYKRDAGVKKDCYW